jgi:uncharacterized Zn-binding protein involved in type VI secretion
MDYIMPGIVRKELDKHIGHASQTPNPFHQTAYNEGSPTVFVNSKPTVRIGDKTSCGDPAKDGSPTVFVNSIKAHRQGDATEGHDSWSPTSAETGSSNVFAN